MQKILKETGMKKFSLLILWSYVNTKPHEITSAAVQIVEC